MLTANDRIRPARSIPVRHDHLTWHRVTAVVRVVYPRRQANRSAFNLPIGDLRQQMRNAVEARPFLVHGLNHPPRSLGNVRPLEHDLLGSGVILPAPPRLHVHRAQFPLLERIVYPTEEAQMLFLVGDRKPILDEPDAGTHEHALELRHRTKEFFVFSVAAKSHYVLDASAVVPAAVE